ncbi:MAG: hypothetical protein ACK4NW_03770 [Roseinatronobacter sp.]
MQDMIAEFAVAGDFGTDVFRRVDDRNQRRHRYECIATITDAGTRLIAYHDIAEEHPERMFVAARQFHDAGFLAQRFALGDPTSYPRAAEIGGPFKLFLYLDFFRLWQIAEQEITRMTALAQSGTSCSAPEIATGLRLVLDFNRIRDARALIEGFTPQLMAIARSGKDDKWQNAGFSLRMVGDLHMRAGDPVSALAAYDGAILLGDNRHRRGLAVKAAHAAGLRVETIMHLEAYQRRWTPTDQIDAIQNSLMPQTPGEPV